MNLRKHLDARAAETAEPTPAQAEAGNYRKGRVKAHGLDIVIETPRGALRHGVDASGKPWSCRMPAHYGYISKTEGSDGDELDVYLGPHLRSGKIFVMDQLNSRDRSFDEHKIFMGFASRSQIEAIYRKCFSDGKADDRRGPIVEMDAPGFRAWLATDTTRPIKRAAGGRVGYADGGEPSSLSPDEYMALGRRAEENYERSLRGEAPLPEQPPQTGWWDTIKGVGQGVADTAKRFAQYDRQFTEDVFNAPAAIARNPSAAGKTAAALFNPKDPELSLLKSAKEGFYGPIDSLEGRLPMWETDPQTGERRTSAAAVQRAMDTSGLAGGASFAAKPQANAVGSGFTGKLYHGSPEVDLPHIAPSERGPLGPGVYTTPHDNLAQRYAGPEGRIYEKDAEGLDIYRGNGHRTDEEYFGFKDDKRRLVEAAEPEHRAAVAEIMDKTWGEGYPLYGRLRNLYKGDEGAQDLFKRAGFDGLSGIVDGHEVLLFGQQTLASDSGKAGRGIAAAGKQKLPMDEASRMARADEQGYGGPWYHGGERMDRFTENGKIDPRRANSGPMPYFTDDPDVASSYARGKPDTSMPEGNTADYFTVSPKDLGLSGRSPITVEQSWYFLPAETKADILAKAKRVGHEAVDEAEGPFKLHDKPATISDSTYDRYLQQHRGNPLAALRELWVDSGHLFDNPDQLSEIYRLAGYPARISETNAPWTEAKGVLPARLRMTNPLDTGDMGLLSEKILPALEREFTRDRSRAAEYGADQWDKRTTTPREWIAKAKEDYANGDNSFVWTQIPDKITAALTRMGYDGILDTGGKMAGAQGGHRVAIPFRPDQVRSQFAKFDPKHLGKSGLLLSDTQKPGQTVAAAGHGKKAKPQWMQDVLSRAAEKKAMAAELAAGNAPVRLAHPDGRTVLAGPDMSKDGVFRLTRLDGDGPVGHTEHKTLQEAVLEGLRGGYVASAPKDARLARARDQGFNTEETLYHGTSKDADFKKFKDSRHGTWTTRDPKEASAYATSNDSMGHTYDGRNFVPTNTASRVIPMHAKPLENPFVVTEYPESLKYATNYKKAQSEWFDQMKRAGHDGVIFPDGVRVDFDNSKLRSRAAQFDRKHAGKSGLLLSDTQKPGSTVAAAGRSLPMDEASRMARAAEQGYTRDAVHGTQAPEFDAFKRKNNDIGIHFGTPEQANDRMNYMREVGARPEEGMRNIPVKLAIKNPLRLDDIGFWGSDNLQYALRKNGFDSDEIREALRAGNESGKIANLRGLIEKKGYDGIVYKNTGEVGGGESLRAAVKEARDELRAAFPEKKPGRTYSFSREEQQHPAYKKLEAAESAEKAHRETNGEDSFIAFRPNQARSRFAAFDPKNNGKSGLLLSDSGHGKALGAAGQSIKRLPSTESLQALPHPSVENMQKLSRVETVPLSEARTLQDGKGGMDWAAKERGEYSEPLIDGYGDKPVAVRKETGEYVILDGNHRTVKAINGGAKDLEMYVIDAKDYAPHAAGVKPNKKGEMSDDHLLAALGARELPMDDASRLARAKEQGFDTSRTVYHGSPDARGIEEKGFQTLRERMGSNDPGRAFFFADDHRTAKTYADPNRAWDYQGSEPAVISAFLRMSNPKTIDWGGKKWRGTDEHIAKAKAEGHDGVIIKNVIDDYGVDGKKSGTVRVVFNPEQIRSPKAAFDPQYTDKGGLLLEESGHGRAIGAAGHNFADDAYRERAVQNRNKGYATGKSAAGWDRKRPDEAKDSVSRPFQELNAHLSNARSNVADQKMWADNPNLTRDDRAFLDSGVFRSDTGHGRAVSAAGHSKPAFMKDVRRPSEDIHEVVDANFTYGRAGKNETVPIDSLKGGIGQAADDAARVDALADKMSGEGGYFERIIADQDGNVVEGQHRLDALRKLGVDRVPIQRVHDLAAGVDMSAVEKAVNATGSYHSDHIHGIIKQALESKHEYGSAAKALEETEMPGQWQKPYEAALKAMEGNDMKRAHGGRVQRFAEGGAPDDFVVPADDFAVPTEPEKHSALSSANRGMQQGVFANFADEIDAMGQAGGFGKKKQSWLGGEYEDRSVAPLVTGAVKYWTGDEETAREYEKNLAEIRKRDKEMQEQNPWSYGGGQLGGAIAGMAVMPQGAFIRGTGTGAQAARGAFVGAEGAALSGAGAGEDAGERLAGAGVGTVVGAGGGALATYALGAISERLIKPGISAIRGIKDPDGEASRRLLSALTADSQMIMSGKANGMTLQQWVAAKQAGEPVTLADLGAGNTQSLLRSSANTSPEGRAMLEKTLNDRFHNQSERVATDVRGLVSGGANAHKTADQLVAEYDVARGPFYKAAFRHPKAQALWDDEFAQMSTAPAVQNAIAMATVNGRNEAAKLGLAPPPNPFVRTQDGRMVLNQFDPNDPLAMMKPNLQFWDVVKKNLDAGDRQSQQWAKVLRDKLDTYGTGYDVARGHAAKFFGERDALAAGRSKAAKSMEPNELAKVMRQMNNEERDLFREGFASDWADRVIGDMKDTRDLTTAMFNSPNARKRAMVVFGPTGMKKIEARMALETIMDSSRKAMGNSTTARQLIEAGLAGGALGGYQGYDKYGWLGAVGGTLGGAAAGRAGINHAVKSGMTAGAQRMIGKVDAKTARRVAELLTSNNPADLARGMQMATGNNKIAEGLRSIANRLALAGEVQGVSPMAAEAGRMFGSVPARADEEYTQP